jgi:hypothetical protein
MITPKNFPTPVDEADVPAGTIVIRHHSGNNTLAMVVRLDDRDQFLVLAELGGSKTDHPVPVLEYDCHTIERLDGEIIARPRKMPGVTYAEYPPHGSLSIGSDGAAAIRVLIPPRSNDIAHISLETGIPLKVATPRTYYGDWEIVLVDGDKETVLASFLKPS